MSADHGAEHAFEHALGIQARAGGANPRNGIDHITHAAPGAQGVVHVLQHALGSLVLADLEELDPDLPGRGVEAVEFLCGRDNGGVHVVGGLAVGDDDDIERLHGVFALFFQIGEIRAQDLVQAGSRRGPAAGLHAGEDGFHQRGGGDVFVFAVLGVQEVDVDPVGVVLGAHGRDPLQRFGGFAPARPDHGAGVVDQEDGVEGR